MKAARAAHGALDPLQLWMHPPSARCDCPLYSRLGQRRILCASCGACPDHPIQRPRGGEDPTAKSGVAPIKRGRGDRVTQDGPDKYILVLRSTSPLISSPHGHCIKIFLAMSSSSPYHPQSRFTTPFPAAASNELHTVSGTSHGDETSNIGNRPHNKPVTFGGVGVPEELVYDSDLEEASERPQRQRQGSLWTRGLAAVSPLFASSNKHNKTSVASAPLLPFDGNHSKLHPRWLKKPTRSCCILYCVVGFLTML